MRSFAAEDALPLNKRGLAEKNSPPLDTIGGRKWNLY